MIEKLTNKHDYDVLIDSVPRLKLQRTITELGICDQFNSELSHIFATDFLINDRMQAKKSLFEVNYFDANPHIVLNDLDDSNVRYSLKCRILHNFFNVYFFQFFFFLFFSFVFFFNY